MTTRGGRRAAFWALHAALTGLAGLTLLPLFWMVSASFMPTGEANAFPPRFLPSRFTLEHYHDLVARLHLTSAFLNSALVAGSITLTVLATCSMAGYAFAKLRFRGASALYQALLAALVIPAQVAMLPLFLLLKELHLVNSYLGVIIPLSATVFGIFLVRQYALSIPDELIAAARVDGAGEFRIYWSVILPLCRPILVTLATFTFMGTWNDFMLPLIVLSDEEKQTLPVALASLVGEHVQDTELMMAGAVLTVLPVLVLFAALQRYYIEGITAGSVKG